MRREEEEGVEEEVVADEEGGRTTRWQGGGVLEVREGQGVRGSVEELLALTTAMGRAADAAPRTPPLE